MGTHGTFALPTGSCSQASAHVAYHDVATGRRKAARHEEVVSSVDERSAVGCKPGAPYPRQVRSRLKAKARAGAIPKRGPTRKGKQHDASRAPDGDVDRRGSPGGVSCPRRNANRATAPAREKISGSIGRARASVSQVAESDFRSSFAVRAAERRFVRLASGGQPRRRRKTRRGSCCERTAATMRRKTSRIV